MILHFFVEDGQEFIQINENKPMVQDNKWCHSMHQLAAQIGGISFSDEPIDGWGVASKSGDHLYGNMTSSNGSPMAVMGGGVRDDALRAIGFKIDGRKFWWRAGNRIHLLTYKQYEEWVKLAKSKRDEYIAGLYPVVSTITPAPEKKGRKRRGEATITLSV